MHDVAIGRRFEPILKSARGGVYILPGDTYDFGLAVAPVLNN